jgi:hypothetical protein
MAAAAEDHDGAADARQARVTANARMGGEQRVAVAAASGDGRRQDAVRPGARCADGTSRVVVYADLPDRTDRCTGTAGAI